MKPVSLSKAVWRFVAGFLENMIILSGLGIIFYLLVRSCFFYLSTAGVDGTLIGYGIYTLLLGAATARATVRMFIDAYDTVLDLCEYRRTINSFESVFGFIGIEENEEDEETYSS